MRLLQELTADKKLILEKLASLGEVRGIGGWQLRDEAIYQAARYLERANPPLTRRIIPVIIGGNLPSVRMFLGHSPRTALKAVYRSNAMVYGIIVRTPEPIN